VADFSVVSDKNDRSRALFLEASRVLLHPRCANCHPAGDVPLQGPQPVVAVARVDGSRCEVWAPTQNPQAAQTEVARVLGTTPDKVLVHVTFLGGGFGRKSKADFCSEAALLSRRLRAPVRVQFTREDDVRHDYVNAVSTNRLTAGLDANGRVSSSSGRAGPPNRL
jgi:isoquinoline 1-oxidoreductase beta subunit